VSLARDARSNDRSPFWNEISAPMDRGRPRPLFFYFKFLAQKYERLIQFVLVAQQRPE